MSLYRRSLIKSAGLKVESNFSGGLEGALSVVIYNVNIYISSAIELQEFCIYNQIRYISGRFGFLNISLYKRFLGITLML